jgi:dTDP-4-dehydrorhamnose 3,5-epimerase
MLDAHLALDDSAARATSDAQTVTRSGKRVDRVIDGVRSRSAVNHVDHRGRVFEIYPGQDEYWQEPLVYCYAFTVRPGHTKGWGLHQHKADRYTLVAGELLTVLYDARSESGTHGLVQQITLSEQGTRQLTIPTGVWHMNINLGPGEAFLINHPTQPYKHEQPDRLLLPWNTEVIPVDVSSFFPKQSLGPVGSGGSGSMS